MTTQPLFQTIRQPLAQAILPTVKLQSVLDYGCAWQADSDKSCSLEALSRVVAQCEQCALSSSRTQTVFDHGNPKARLMLIGEAPGQAEDESGIPFVGRSGKLLTTLLAKVGLHRPDDIYICNVIKCRPPNNRKPTTEEVMACRGYLVQQVALVKPKVILLAGATALHSVFKISTPISKIRGQWLALPQAEPFADCRAMAIFHPSYLLRYASDAQGTPRWLTLQDLECAKAALSGA
ncbi:MAG: uracil-DNA glycosylase [Vampirovibrionales bacterium]|nr:uracil-DNA glycosylase [Vampirovibrionales bacterium]